MDKLMFVNGLDGMNNCCITPDPAQYGKFMCMYSFGGTMQEYKRHQKCGFNSHAEAISWYFERCPNGNVLSERNFLDLQTQLLMLKMPSQPNVFDPTFMIDSTKSKPTSVKRDKSGKIISDFE